MVVGIINPVAANDVRLQLLKILYVLFAKEPLCKLTMVVDVIGAAVDKVG